MLKNLVKQLSNNPSTGNVSLPADAPAGYVTFASQFSEGAQVMYFITNGADTECCAGVFTTGNLSRGALIWSSTGARVDFTGSVTVFVAQPAERTLWGDSDTTWDARSRRMKNLANAAGNTDAVPFGQLGWYVAGESVSSTSQPVVDFAVPASTPRLRFEFADCAPATTTADMYMRVSRDGGATYMAGASDYLYNQGLNAVPGAQISIAGGKVFEAVMGFVEMQVNGKQFGYAIATGPIDKSANIPAGPNGFQQTYTGFACNVSGANITHVLFGFVGVSVVSHRIRMLAQRV